MHHDERPVLVTSSITSSIPAGKASHPQKNTSYQGVNNITSSLSYMLSENLVRKQKIEDELRGIGTHPKVREQIDRKQELEINMEIINKNISNLRQKLKEFQV